MPRQERAKPPYPSVLVPLAAHVTVRPDRVALEWQGECMDYGSLWGMSGAITQALLTLELERDDIVGLIAETPPSRIAGLLGVMRAGGIVTPLGSEDPVPRVRVMIEKVGPAAFVVQGRGLTRLQELIGNVTTRVVAIGTPTGETLPSRWQVTWVDPQSRVDLPVAPIDANAPAYIFFTSGSTGIPKPIVGRTESLAQFIHWEIEEFGLGPDCRVSQIIAPTFDASLRDLFVPLCAGGTACVPPKQVHEMEPSKLIEWLEQSRVTLVHTVPTLFRSWLAECSGERLPDLTHLLLAGEMLRPVDVKRWREAVSDRIELVNLYGTTETTMIASLCRSEDPSPARRRSFSMSKERRVLPGQSANSTCARRSSRLATTGIPSARRRRSCPIRCARIRPISSTAPAIWRWCCPTETCGSSDAATSRSRCAGCGWSWARSRRP
jgi:iturin family lipopeptide synthetase A